MPVNVVEVATGKQMRGGAAGAHTAPLLRDERERVRAAEETPAIGDVIDQTKGVRPPMRHQACERRWAQRQSQSAWNELCALTKDNTPTRISSDEEKRTGGNEETKGANIARTHTFGGAQHEENSFCRGDRRKTSPSSLKEQFAE